ncbi:hypothetical protein UG55_100816 [Frankia sp. EI5c]|uniref:hypothetical protein n=1 Tax=Frankia sp. EI5c TaxID=683316 RepID=UPI0007C2434A|nr:hypothetical protein [Frankia sp. EI5c]OAA27365.1 hypothetical protein UG55_100816 [Frankia sp. EI5c]
MTDQQLTFRAWVRERIAQAATGVQDGRPLVSTTVTLAGTDARGAATTAATRPVRFLLAGPADVVGLTPAAIGRRYPAPGTTDHESDRCPLVEFTDPALPWRYSPAPGATPGSGTTHPWLVLVVGVEGEELTLAGDQVALSPAVQAAHPLGAAAAPYPWAHVQDDATGRRIARVLSGRPLQPGTDYLAALVPAFDAAGQRSWAGTGPVIVPCHDHWRFRTATPAGSFEDLAARLHPGGADPGLGQAPLDYPRVPEAGGLAVRGALGPLAPPGEPGGDPPLPGAVRADLTGLRTPATDPKGRPIVGLPRYGEAWRTGAPETAAWAESLNNDPRHRGAAGLGLELGIRLQEELVSEVSASLGALAEARQRIADLVLGRQAAGAVWERRMPAEPLERLWLLGPALNRVVTPGGTLGELATAADRPLPPGIFSTAARRVLRTGPARTARSSAGRVRPGDVLAAANQCRPAPPRADDGVPLGELGIDLDELEERRRHAAETGTVDLDTAVEVAKALAERADSRLRDLAHQIADRLAEAAAAGTPAPWARALELLVAAAAVPAADDAAVRELITVMQRFLELFPAPAEEGDLDDVLDGLEEPEPVEPPCRPVDLDVLTDVVVTAFDPTGPQAPAVVRVLETIDGLDPAQPLAPPEPCVELDRPVWADLRAAFAEWLLPGVGSLPDDSVIALATNPRFVDALLTGLNTQLLAELRWRGVPVATGCTPLRVFWDRSQAATGARVADITGLQHWPDDSDLGSAAHRPAGAAGQDLVVVVRGRLFSRYPATVVYLISAEHGAGGGGTADFTVDPDPAAPRIYPGFQGRIGPDVVFFGFQGVEPADVARYWLVLEEPPAGYRFANDASTATAPHSWATEAFAHPVRVLIAGDRLDDPAPTPTPGSGLRPADPQGAPSR